MKCNHCNNEFEAGTTDGLPNGVGFQLEDGKVINLCQKCIQELGSFKTEEEVSEFFTKCGLDDIIK